LQLRERITIVTPSVSPKRASLPNYFINESLIATARQENFLLVHPHAQRTGGGAFRTRVLMPIFGQQQVYSKLFVPGAKRWSRLKESDLANYRAYTDLHNFTRIGMKRPFGCVALLRDPVYRAISLYHFARQFPDHRHHALAAQFGPEEFYRRASPRDPTYLRNVQCRRICGYGSARRALEFIRHYYIGVGFTAELSSFVEALRAVFGWPKVALKPFSGNNERYAMEASPAFRRIVLADNRADQELFEIMSAGQLLPQAASVRGELRTWTTEARDISLAVLRRAAQF
jgi:hypothetical protein